MTKKGGGKMKKFLKFFMFWWMAICIALIAIAFGLRIYQSEVIVSRQMLVIVDCLAILSFFLTFCFYSWYIWWYSKN